ncbi:MULTISPECIES: TVP38/TMEM64 family protein [Streptomyces]|uniref:TVP38/TMEM64 family membrane protein n=1 Tax=Streptomyces stelliscabiei TaxID=146820 RepID=A0A8I0TPC8_9ACTN|nr:MULTISPECIES: VTT domain-containing protein [Streptomyces]KND42138.1 membrane protein [Streptomyces stelliscabiei]MBE1595459.1 putative membrane protein YdjX (TVP38/TMEM64 family) [Streptomyces stelliscabiei]MDX2517293.1 VTT domain-containing protein [Streptomyces stelliscabiei]MDX2554626.1 VTT domain-containing protein [Streptomyces stelliscabiei]MDX2613154.1 VTT domain-containing protein [Streptomyces stelliscabiei]
MLDATTRSGGTATVLPRTAATELAVAAPVVPPVAVPTVPPGRAARWGRVLLAPWARFSFLVLLLLGAVSTVLWFEPQRLLADGWPPQLSGAAAVVMFAVAYGLCTVAFVPRPILNIAAGALFGSQLGLASALAGTVLGAGIAFGLGRMLGQDALRPLLRHRWLKSADGQLSRHGFRSMLAARLFPGVPFWAANYCASVSRMGCLPFLLATALGSIPNTAAYAVAGARASSPTSPAFLIAMACIAVPALVGAALAWRKRHHLRAR